jgi:Mg-chelatase subunit ChlD
MQEQEQIETKLEETMKQEQIETKLEGPDIVIIGDRSGSMECMGSEPLQAMNEFINDCYTKNPDLITNIQVVLFSTKLQTVIDEKLSAETKIKSNEYVPNGGTALHDAICKTINKKVETNRKNCIILIFTDGEENSSQEHNIEETRLLIKKVQDDYNYKIIFMGANFDVYKEGSNMNIQRERTCEFNQRIPGHMNIVFRSASTDISNYARNVSLGINNDLVIQPTQIDEIDDIPELEPWGEIPLFDQKNKLT